LPEPADREAFDELQYLVRNLGEEISSFRHRAHTAESRLKAIATRGGGGDAAAEERVAQLEAENARLRERLAEASEKANQVLGRVRFLRQQHDEGAR
jgi:hypothetical protein